MEAKIYIMGGGRVTLIQAALTSIPIYFLYFFRIPKTMVEKIKKIQRRFLWVGPKSGGRGLDELLGV